MSKYLPINLFIRQALIYPLTSPFLPAEDKVEEGHSYAAGRKTGTLSAGGGLPFTGQVLVKQAGDDGTYQKGYTLTRPIVKGAVGNTRFVDNGDGTITDLATNLMWVQDPKNDIGAPFNAKVNWTTAITNCEALAFAGHSDWRLPNSKEVVSIIDHGATMPAIDAMFVCDTDVYYWTSTSLFTDNLKAWCSKFAQGMMYYQTKTQVFWVRPVRLGLP